MNKELAKHVKHLAPKFNAGALLDIPTGKFITDERLNGGSLQSFHLGNVYPRNSGQTMLMYDMIMDSLRKTAPETVERYTLAAKLFQVMGLGVKWDDETKAPIASWLDLEGNMDHMPDMIQEIFTKDYAKELAEREQSAKKLAGEMMDIIKDGIRTDLQQAVHDQVFGAGTVIQEHHGSGDNIASKTVVTFDSYSSLK